MKRKEPIPRGLEIDDVAGRIGGGPGRGQFYEPTPRGRIGGNNPPGEPLPIERGAKPRAKPKSKSPYELPKERKKEDKPLPKPAIITDPAKSMPEKIFEHAEQKRTPVYEKATDPVFEKADPELTKRLVPQVSIADQLPQHPDPGKEFPLFDRSRGIYDQRSQLARMLANTIENAPGDPLPFYSTGTVLEGLANQGGLSMEEAQTLMRDWAGQGAATSPRTKTPTNLRNASYLLWRNAQGDPLRSEAQWKAEGNRPGYPMIGKMHVPLAEGFRTGTVDPLKNSKPYTFRENWTGNMSDVTADTHNIRATLDAYDKLFPGTLSRQWFDSDAAFQAYRTGGGFPKTGSMEELGIKDTAGTAMINGRKTQTEYPILQGPTQDAAKLLGLKPAEAQERLWFGAGPRTGLMSPPMTIPDLLNSQFETTAKVLGISPAEVMKLWAKRRIPLAENEPQNVPGETATG